MTGADVEHSAQIKIHGVILHAIDARNSDMSYYRRGGGIKVVWAQASGLVVQLL